jgi:hypothetical protein
MPGLDPGIYEESRQRNAVRRLVPSRHAIMDCQGKPGNDRIEALDAN